MDKYGVFCEFLVKYLMYHIFIAVNYLHLKHIIHGNIKKENILVSFFSNKNSNNDIDIIFKRINENKAVHQELMSKDDFKKLTKEAKEIINSLLDVEIYISDFGTAKMKKSEEKIKEITGTSFYRSPEVIKKQYDYECDEWSCGVLMYILLSGIAPFKGLTEKEVMENILKGKADFKIDELKNISGSCKDLMAKLLNKNPEVRIKASDALKHEFFTKGINIKKIIVSENEIGKLQKISSFANRTLKQIVAKKRFIFRESCIAYMTLHFTDQEEAKEIRGIFRKLSGDNPKYQITKKAFVEKMKELFPEDYTNKELTELFDSLDDNLNGTIEYEELKRGLGDRSKLINIKNLKETFNFFDKDKNGYISVKEICDIVFLDQEVTPNVMKEFLEELKMNEENSKEIDFNKFIEIMGFKNLLD